MVGVMGTERINVTNNSLALQGVRGVGGVVYIPAGATKSVEFDENGFALAKRLSFLSFDAGSLDHDGDGRKGGSDPADREDLKKQADELGIQYAKNIPTEKLRDLIDAKLAS